jgi:hypothetical protein
MPWAHRHIHWRRIAMLRQPATDQLGAGLGCMTPAEG